MPGRCGAAALPCPMRGARRPALAGAAESASGAAVKCLAGAPRRSPRQPREKRFQSQDDAVSEEL